VQMRTNRYAKLPRGTWGARIYGGKPRPGEKVVLVKKSGDTDEREVNRCLFETPSPVDGSWLVSLRHKG
jgi:hypothetical protein